MSKLAKKIMCLALCACLILPFAACSGTSGGKGGKGGKGSKTGGDSYDYDIAGIQARYDAAGVKYETYAEDDPDVTLTMAHWDSSGADRERAVIDTLLTAFNNRYPNITVDLEIKGSYEATYVNKFASNTLDDVFMVSDGAYVKWQSLGKMADLSGLISDSDLVSLNDMIPSVVSRYQTGGKNYVLPKDISCHAMFYNKDYFDLYADSEYPTDDAPMALSDAVSMWRKFPNNSTTNVWGCKGFDMEGLVWSAGGDFLTGSNTIPTSGTSRTALERAYSFIQNTYFANGGAYDGVGGHTAMSGPITPVGSKESGTGEALFMSGKVATCICGNWNYATFKESITDFAWDVAYVPAFTENPGANGWSGSVGYAMPNYLTGDKKTAAWALIEYIASPEGQEVLSCTGFQFPCYEELALSDDFLETELARDNAAEHYSYFVKQAATQPAGPGTHFKNSTWKNSTYDACSEKLLDENATNRINVSTFLTNVANALSGINLNS